jgi:hypothetical protein
MAQLTRRWTRAVVCVLAISLMALGTVAGVAVGQAEDMPMPKAVAPSLEPAITEIEVDWKGDGKLKLRAEVVPRGAKVTSVFFKYRGKRFRAKKTGQWKYAKTVKARGGDGRGDRVRFKVRACTATVCGSRTDGDKAN